MPLTTTAARLPRLTLSEFTIPNLSRPPTGGNDGVFPGADI